MEVDWLFVPLFLIVVVVVLVVVVAMSFDFATLRVFSEAKSNVVDL